MSEVVVPSGFKQAVVAPLINLSFRRLHFYQMTSGVIALCQDLASCQNLSSGQCIANFLNIFISITWPMCLSLLTKLVIQMRQPHYQYEWYVFIPVKIWSNIPRSLCCLWHNRSLNLPPYSQALVWSPVVTWFSSYLQNIYPPWCMQTQVWCPPGLSMGPLLFSLYTSHLSYVIEKHKGILFHFYADDTQLYIHLNHKNATSAMDKLNSCLHDVKNWMDSNKLKLNADKTELIVFVPKSRGIY